MNFSVGETKWGDIRGNIVLEILARTVRLQKEIKDIQIGQEVNYSPHPTHTFSGSFILGTLNTQSLLELIKNL